MTYAAAPYVAGFERIDRADESRPESGILLLRELNCITCHTLDPDAGLSSKQAPDLQQIADRASPFFVESFLKDPQAAQPGSTMPALLAHLDDAERNKVATQLTHYLTSLRRGEFRQTPPNLAAVSRGDQLYHDVGCVACHSPLREDATPIANSRSFPSMEAKYSHSGLTRFLRDPLAVRPSGRMPSLNLSDREASDIAHYLLRDTRLPAALSYSIYTGRRDDLNDKRELPLTDSGHCDGFTIDVPHRSAHYTIQFDGFLRIEQPGQYTFHVKADDGARLFIDDQLVVDNNTARNRDRAVAEQGSVKLQSGLRAISLTYFQRGRAAQLVVEWEGPGRSRSQIPMDVLQNARDLPAVPKPWIVDHTQAEIGKQKFVALGCNTCHPLQSDATRLATKGLVELNPDSSTGCMNASPGTSSHPRYPLDERQRAAIKTSIDFLKSADKPASSVSKQIDNSLTQFDCYACHQRDGQGGPVDERKAYFTSSAKDMGDEGRLPPLLTGVGDKLQKGWLREVLVNRGTARPYMNTPHATLRRIECRPSLGCVCPARPKLVRIGVGDGFASGSKASRSDPRRQRPTPMYLVPYIQSPRVDRDAGDGFNHHANATESGLVPPLSAGSRQVPPRHADAAVLAGRPEFFCGPRRRRVSPNRSHLDLPVRR